MRPWCSITRSSTWWPTFTQFTVALVRFEFSADLVVCGLERIKLIVMSRRVDHRLVTEWNIIVSYDGRRLQALNAKRHMPRADLLTTTLKLPPHPLAIYLRSSTHSVCSKLSCNITWLIILHSQLSWLRSDKERRTWIVQVSHGSMLSDIEIFACDQQSYVLAYSYSSKTTLQRRLL